MTQLLDRATEQRFIQTGLSWENFKVIQKGFADSPGVRLLYYRGEIEILSTSSEHEIVKGNIGFLVEVYMLNLGVEFVATGSFSQEKEGEASAQADESYCFGEKKPRSDLAIEVVITSGGLNKLNRYKALGVQEVWFWQDGVITMYYLDGEYKEVQRSQFLPDLDIKQLAWCAAISSRSQAVKEFKQGARG